MSFEIKLFHNGSPKNQMTKTLADETTVEGTLKDGTSLIDPTILFHGTIAALRFANYMYIDDFKRFYFIKNITSVRNGLVELEAHVDVISTYADAIKANYGIVKRNQNANNILLNDGFFKVYQNPHIVTKVFPQGFTTQEFVLAMAGS